MHGGGKSDPAIVARKPANNAERSAAEPVERRACPGLDPGVGTEGNAGQQSTHRAQDRVSVTQALDRVREAARQRKKRCYGANAKRPVCNWGHLTAILPQSWPILISFPPCPANVPR